jgi:putative oxidoreductase
MLEKFIKNHEDHIYFIFRVMVGLLFMQHGAQKLFGIFGGNVAELFNLFWFAGIIEFFGGLLIVIGLFTRVAAFFSIANMIGAWFIAHVKNGWIPIVNKGELALLYLAAFLIIFVYGAKKWGLDKKFFKYSSWFF